MNWVRGAEPPGTAGQNVWWPLPEPRGWADFAAHWKLWADGRDYSGNDGGCNQDGRPGAIVIGGGGGPGTIPKSTYFPGSGNCFRSGNGMATSITIPITGAHWVYPTVAGQGAGGLLNHYHNSTHIPFYSMIGGPAAAAGVWGVGAYHLTYGHSVLSSGFTPPVNQFSWLCWTVDAARTIRCYVNGAQTATGTLAFVPASCQQDIWIGARWDGNAFVGYASDFRLYNKALSAAEILEIYQRSMGTITNPAWVPVG